MIISPLDRIQSHYDELTATDKEVAIWFINHAHDSITGKSAEDIAKATGTSKAAISRFCQKVGYSGFSDFRFSLARALVSSNDSSGSETESNPIAAIADLYASFIKEIPSCVSEEQLSDISLAILAARKVKIFALNRTYNSALQFKQRMARLGIDAEAISDTAVISDLIDMMDQRDTAIIFTTTDNMNYWGDRCAKLKERGVTLIVLTMNPNLPFKKHSNQYVTLPRISKNGAISFMDDQALFMVFIEIMLNNLAKHIND